MRSQEHGFATAKLELWNGYPGYFYIAGDGNYIWAVEKQYGLPVKLFGDAAPDRDWSDGFNRGVVSYIKEFGLPWNSRLASLNVISDLPGYFRNHASEATRLLPNGPAFKPRGFGLSLSLEREQTWTSLKVEADNLFKNPKIVQDAGGPYRLGPHSGSMPATPAPPSLGPGTASVGLVWLNEARCIECLPAPLGSHLVVFRFSDIVSGEWPARQTEEFFAVLDTQLMEWFPGGLFDAALAGQSILAGE